MLVLSDTFLLLLFPGRGRDLNGQPRAIFKALLWLHRHHSVLTARGLRRDHRWSHMSSYPKRGFSVLTDTLSLCRSSKDHFWYLSRSFSFCLQFLFPPLFDFSVGLQLHVLWYSHAYIAFCIFVLDIVDWETEWCCLCPATWYDYHTGILKAAYIFIVLCFL